MENKRRELLRLARFYARQMGLPFAKALDVVSGDPTVVEAEQIKQVSMQEFIREWRRRLRLTDIDWQQAFVAKYPAPRVRPALEPAAK